jgi:hypothetical protein
MGMNCARINVAARIGMLVVLGLPFLALLSSGQVRPSKTPNVRVDKGKAFLRLHAMEQRGMTAELGIEPHQRNRFGYLFPALVENPDCTLPFDETGRPRNDIVTALNRLADEMKNDAGADGPIPAVYTYLGQFLDHDLTFDPVSQLSRENDPLATRNFRPPGLNLDSLYGNGPHVSPFMYDVLHATPELRGRAMLFREIGGATPGGDLARNQQGTAIIGDARNDENLVIAQTHLLFLRFHNRIATLLKDQAVPTSQLFDRTAQQVRWHYQWLVLNDFLPKVLSTAVINDVKANGPKFYRPPEGDAYMPVEFSIAAFRFGHSMVRDTYDYNTVFTTATLGQLFNFTHNPIPDNWTINWKNFSSNQARPIDIHLAASLLNLPGSVVSGPPVSLAERNLQRGYVFRLPTGQCVARFIGAVPLTEAQIKQDSAVLITPGTPAEKLLVNNTPLWYYILKEAKVTESGERLGPVGSRIVAEVIIGLLKADETSILAHPEWSPPGLGGTTAGQFTFADLITIGTQ